MKTPGRMPISTGQEKLSYEGIAMKILENLRSWCRVKEDARELSRLSTRDLEDIGLSAACITVVSTRRGL
jgi:uncharacterized protein YjiS (DUF1127 family)